ncbi:MAG: two-component system response regulator [Betaproteobacteria bacterium RIFCSPLOWO2_02_FULL_65_24]|nr:MAG: two-component system response regulator [Betaproteobacteria bacterium RIFCSPLOWO2_02_FULL_65_24]OGA79797.1 MAG: two-component system response regulator [Betaproteobacteria bacterium RIFCSPLOWO2_12_FULL_66_14]
MERGQILLVDDNEYDVDLTLRALKRRHFANEVQVARDGVEALDYLYRRGPFAERAPGNPLLVLLDLKMPKVDGIEVLKVIKGDQTLKSIPVVVLTSSQDQQDVVESYGLGVNAYVVKPVEFEKVMDAVQQLGLFWLLHNQPPAT